jgi:hypothetical protein
MSLQIGNLPSRARTSLLAAMTAAQANNPSHAMPLFAADGNLHIQTELKGITPSDDDEQDYPFVWSGRPVINEMDFQCSPIKNQKQAGACTAFHATGHAERYALKAGVLPPGGFSERANYNMSRSLLGFTGDSGATLRAAIHAGHKYGFPTEAQFPYSDAPAIINDLSIPDAVMTEAALNKFDAYYRIDKSVKDDSVIQKRIDRALADGMTVGVGTFLFRWFYYIKGPLSTHKAVRNNPIQLPAGQSWWDIIGGHAMVFKGRSDSMGGYITRNSWDTIWGDQGEYLFPFEDLQYAFEFWAVAGFDGSDTDQSKYDMDSAEAKAFRLYMAALGRYPDAPGLQWHTQAIESSGHYNDACAFMASAEAQKRFAGLSDNDFVTALYNKVLNRAPDSGGLSYYTNLLRNGTFTRPGVLMSFAESPEFRTLLAP